jgi:uncharacterized Rmd1/YagE family protein
MFSPQQFEIVSTASVMMDRQIFNKSAQIFKKSVAEQNSVDLGWGILVLMLDEFEALRACIYLRTRQRKNSNGSDSWW